MRDLRGRLRDDTIWFGWTMLVLGPVLVVFFHRHWVEGLFSVLLGGGILLVMRPWSADRHAAWVVRVEPDRDDVAHGRSFDPYFVPECKCGWDDPFYDDAADARAAAEKHARGRVEPDFKRTFEPVED